VLSDKVEVTAHDPMNPMALIKVCEAVCAGEPMCKIETEEIC
jgi:hypothetical protein